MSKRQIKGKKHRLMALRTNVALWQCRECKGHYVMMTKCIEGMCTKCYVLTTTAS